MAKSNKTEQSKKRVLKALEESLGIVTNACKEAEIGRTQFYEWINTDEDFAKAVLSVEDIALDFAESQLHKQIREGIPTSTIFYLKTKGKKRGYIERQEFDHTTQGDKIQPTIINLGSGIDPDEATE